MHKFFRIAEATYTRIKPTGLVDRGDVAGTSDWFSIGEAPVWFITTFVVALTGVVVASFSFDFAAAAAATRPRIPPKNPPPPIYRIVNENLSEGSSLNFSNTCLNVFRPKKS